ncbi:MAG: c-type cytochrome biogenesis protein CcmI, partial [Pseudomonadota bacterium]|nr:c-type cytochrome biogenesis protein CcmI [Pseudomonadota bacterium]
EAMLWIALAVMTGLAMGFALWPLAFRARQARDEAREADFYRAQLDEIARDVERGQLPAQEAASARAEAARRLIAVSGAPAQAGERGSLGRRRVAAVVVFVVVPAVALAIYGRLGKPDLPDEPLAARQVDANAPDAVEAAVAKIEAHLTKAPNDLRGWEVVAPVYMKLGRFADAASAYAHALALGDDKPALRADLGEAMVASAEGVVTAEARKQFDKAPDAPKAKFYLGLAAEQDGKTQDAIAAYQGVEAQAKGREPWMLGLRARLAALTGEAPKSESAPAFSPDQQKMIETMVQGLAQRLASQGGDAQEWGRLIRAYSVLHEPDKARDALASARKALGPNADIDALARELRL